MTSRISPPVFPLKIFLLDGSEIDYNSFAMPHPSAHGKPLQSPPVSSSSPLPRRGSRSPENRHERSPSHDHKPAEFLLDQHRGLPLRFHNGSALRSVSSLPLSRRLCYKSV